MKSVSEGSPYEKDRKHFIGCYTLQGTAPALRNPLWSFPLPGLFSSTLVPNQPWSPVNSENKRKSWFFKWLDENFWKRKGELSSTLKYGQTFHRKEEWRGHCRWETWAKSKSGASWHFLKMWEITSFNCGGSWKSIGLRLMLKARQHREGGTCQDEEVCGRWGVTPCRALCKPLSPSTSQSLPAERRMCPATWATSPAATPPSAYLSSCSATAWTTAETTWTRTTAVSKLRGHSGRAEGPGSGPGVRSQQDSRAGGPVSSCWDPWNRNGKRGMKLKSKTHVT